MSDVRFRPNVSFGIPEAPADSGERFAAGMRTWGRTRTCRSR
jgi:hypothetical protein